MEKNAVSHRLLERFLMPITATAASAGATYVARKLEGAMSERAPAVGGGDEVQDGRRTRTVSSAEFERRRSERAKHRSARQGSSR